MIRTILTFRTARHWQHWANILPLCTQQPQIIHVLSMAATVDRACGCGRCPRYMSRSCAPSTSRMADDMRVCRRRRSPAVAAAEVVVVGSSSCPIGMQCIRGFVDDMFSVNSLFSMFCYHQFSRFFFYRSRACRQITKNVLRDLSVVPCECSARVHGHKRFRRFRKTGK